MGHNELLIAKAIEGRRDRVQLSVKFGGLRGPDGSWGGIDTRPAAIKNFLAYSLTRLGTDVIDIYGLSEVGVETIRRAAKVHPIVDLQIEDTREAADVRAGDRRPHARAARRGARGAPALAGAGHPSRGGGAARRDRRHALPVARDGAAR
jgi:hypothetical protein